MPALLDGAPARSEATGQTVGDLAEQVVMGG